MDQLLLVFDFYAFKNYYIKLNNKQVIEFSRTSNGNLKFIKTVDKSTPAKGSNQT